MKVCGFHPAKHPAIPRVLLFCMGLALAVLAGTAWADQYEYPSDLPKKTLKAYINEPWSKSEHSKTLWSGDIPDRYLFENVHLNSLTLAACELHIRALDGTEIVKTCGSSASFANGKTQTRMLNINFGDWLERNVGDIFLCYFLYKDPPGPWVSQELAVKCGGKSLHSKCNQCFKLISLEVAKRELKSQGASTGAKPMGMERRGGITHEPSRPRPMPASQWQNRTDDGDDLANDEEEVGQSDYWMPAMREYRPGKMIPDRDTTIYSLRALPREEMMGTLKAGRPLYVMEDVGGGFVRVRFITSDGKRYEGAAKKSGLGFSEP
jgi:hypothetical protein